MNVTDTDKRLMVPIDELSNVQTKEAWEEVGKHEVDTHDQSYGTTSIIVSIIIIIIINKSVMSGGQNLIDRNRGGQRISKNLITIEQTTCFLYSVNTLYDLNILNKLSHKFCSQLHRILLISSWLLIQISTTNTKHITRIGLSNGQE